MRQAETGDFQPFDASQWKIGIVVAQFNREITESLLGSALERAGQYNIPSENITVIKVAGCAEIPLALQLLTDSGDYTALLAIGCVIRGETPHFDYVNKFVCEGILRVTLDNKIPVGFGILTCDSIAQAKARSALSAEHLDAALHLAQAL